VKKLKDTDTNQNLFSTKSEAMIMQVVLTFGSVEKMSTGKSKYRLKVKIHD